MSSPSSPASPTSLTPFAQLPYARLPDAPRRPHRFFDAPLERVTVRTEGFGAIAIAARRFGARDLPPLVCVHGLMTTSYSFRYLVEPLADRFHLVTFDLPGAGDSDKPDARYGPAAMADAIAAFVDAAGVRGAPMIGNSMGGYLAMWLALRHPEAASRLVNLHSPGVPTPRMHALAAALAVPGAAAVLDRLVRRDPERWAFSNVHYWDETLKSREEARTYGAPLATPEGRRAFARHLRDTLSVRGMRALAEELRARDGRFPIPLLFVYARRDPMVPPAVGERMAAMVPGAPLVWLDEGSHFAHVDATERFLEVALPFLEAR